MKPPVKTLLFVIASFSFVYTQAQNPRVKSNGNNPGASKTTTTPNNAAPSSENAAKRAESKEQVVLNVNFALGIPDGEFKTISNDNWAFGFTGYIAYNPFHDILDNDYIRPFLLGLQLEYLWFDSKSDDYNFEDAFTRSVVNSKVSNGAFAFGLAGRSEFISKVVYPFVEYHAGFRFFSGSHDITYTRTAKPGVSSNQQNVNESFSKNLESDVVGYYGWAAGIGVNSNNLRIEFKLAYQYGGRARYVDPESVTFNQTNNSVSYSTKTSSTDMIIPQIGISTTF